MDAVIDATVCGIPVGDAHPTRVMGVINLSSESFYKGSVRPGAEALAAAEKMAEEGADFIDIGAASTAPGVEPVGPAEEIARLEAALPAIAERLDMPVSVDIIHGRVAEAALDMGARIINDISGFKADPRMPEVALRAEAPAVVMATERVPGDPLTVEAALAALRESARLGEGLTKAGIPLVIDPGIGRWVKAKRWPENTALIRDLGRFRSLGLPVLVGISRKSFLHEILGRPDPSDRLYGTLAATAIAVFNGAHIVRAHDVAATREVITVAERIRGSVTP